MIGFALKALGFLRSPLGLVLVGGLAALLFTSYVYNKGYEAASLECQAGALKTEIDILKRDIQVAQEAEQEAERLANETAARAIEMEERVRAYEEELASRPDGACVLSDADLERLWGIGS